MKSVARERSFHIDWQEELKSLLSLVLFIGGASLVLQSYSMGLMVTAALGFHELGHILLIRRFGIPWKLRFGLAGAWVETPLDQRQALGHYSNALIHLAGPAFSLLYALAALVIYFVIYRGSEPLLVLLANFSAQVALLNLVPIGNLTDGGKFVHRARASLDTSGQYRLFRFALAWVGAVYIGTVVAILISSSGAFLFFQAASFVIITLWMALGLRVHLNAADPPAESDDLPGAQPMTFRQAWWLAAGVELLLLASTLVTLVTPFWLTQPQVNRIAHAMASLVVAILS